MAENKISSSDSWVRWVLDECPESSIPYAMRFFDPYKRRLENLLRANYVLKHELTLRLSGQLGSQGWSLQSALSLPTGMLVAAHSDETLMGTMDQALELLWNDLKRHLRQNSASSYAVVAPCHKSPQGRLDSRNEMMAPATG